MPLNCPCDELLRKCPCQGLLLPLTTNPCPLFLSSGFCGAAGQPHQAASQNRGGPARTARQTAQPDHGAGGQGTVTTTSLLSESVASHNTEGGNVPPFILVSHPSLWCFGSAEEAISNFDHKQGPFWVKDCCAARLGAVARAHGWGRSSKALSISTRLLYFLTAIFLFLYYYYYLPYYSCSLGLLSIITFHLFLLFQYSLQ